MGKNTEGMTDVYYVIRQTARGGSHSTWLSPDIASAAFCEELSISVMSMAQFRLATATGFGQSWPKPIDTDTPLQSSQRLSSSKVAILIRHSTHYLYSRLPKGYFQYSKCKRGTWLFQDPSSLRPQRNAHKRNVRE